MEFVVKNKKYLSVLAWLALLSILFLTYARLITQDPFLTYDDNFVVLPLQNIYSLQNYINSVLSGSVLDITPVRDLTYIIDFYLVQNSNYWGFHLSNLLIWISILYFFKKILDLYSDQTFNQKALVWIFIFFYALSPVSTSSVAWISARKHLLSTLFILLAQYTFLKNKDLRFSLKNIIFISFFYILSILSQPINVLWVLFSWVYLYYQKKIQHNKLILSVLTTISILGLAINLYYYSGPYVNWSMQEGKYSESSSLGSSFLAFGRYFYLTLFPFDASPVSHFQGSWQNLVGLFLLVLFSYIVYKNRKSNVLLICYFSYFFIPLIPVTAKITRIFCSDTYLLNACLGIYIVLFLILKNYLSKKVLSLLSLYVLAVFIYNLSYIKLFTDAKNIWEFSYLKEPNTIAIAALASASISERNHINAEKLIDELYELDPKHKYIEKLKIDNIYLDSKLTHAEKAEQILKIESKVPYAHYILSKIYLNENNVENFKKVMIDFFSEPQMYLKYAYFDNEQMVAFYKAACEKFKIESECIKNFNRFKQQVSFRHWDQLKYEAEYNEFLMQFNTQN